MCSNSSKHLEHFANICSLVSLLSEIIIMKTLLEKVQTERVRMGLRVPCEALLQLHIQQTLHRRKYTYLQL